MEEITIRIGKDGKVNLNVNGIKGSNCKNITKALEKALGMVVETKNTGEFYEQEQKVDDQEKQGGGW